MNHVDQQEGHLFCNRQVAHTMAGTREEMGEAEMLYGKKLWVELCPF